MDARVDAKDLLYRLSQMIHDMEGMLLEAKLNGLKDETAERAACIRLIGSALSELIRRREQAASAHDLNINSYK